MKINIDNSNEIGDSNKVDKKKALKIIKLNNYLSFFILGARIIFIKLR